MCSADAEQPAGGSAAADTSMPKRKTRVVVLGTGWGAVSFLKSLDPKTFGGGWRSLQGAQLHAPAAHHLAFEAGYLALLTKRARLLLFSPPLE